MGLRTLFKVFGWIGLAIVVTQCAQPGNPGGGPKDTEPPLVVGTAPLNGSANFSETKFAIYFDEFIELDEIRQKVLISPPMRKLPDFKIKGKSLQVKFSEPLKENTTYTIYFSDAIVDMTERNPLVNFTYIFSTGPTVDSMSIRGDVINAINLTPAEDVFVMLYKDENDTIVFDSLPLMVQPFYLSKTDVNGNFEMNGLANTEYLMFAIRDLNGNYIYDQPGEEIAFFDTIISPEFFTEPVADSILADSLKSLEGTPLYDSLFNYIDSVNQKNIEAYKSQLEHYSLALFKEEDTTQVFLKSEMIRENTLRFSFTQPMKDITIETVNYQNDTTWFIEEYSPNHDTLIWYLKDLPIDTLETVILLRNDTLTHKYIRLSTKKAFPGDERRSKKEDEKKDYINLSSNLGKGKLKLNQQLKLTSDFPIHASWTDSILFITGEDSTYNPPFSFVDSIQKEMVFPFTPEESMDYRLVIPDSAFINWNGVFNKKTTVRFKTLSLRDYGILRVNLKSEKEQNFVVQILKEKEEFFKEFYFANDTAITIEHVDPGKYMLKLIFDDNGNRKWDTGNYHDKLQPEKIIYYPKQLDVKGNWEIEEEWMISD